VKDAQPLLKRILDHRTRDNAALVSRMRALFSDAELYRLLLRKGRYDRGEWSDR
jgi:hypothetical protein